MQQQRLPWHVRLLTLLAGYRMNRIIDRAKTSGWASLLLPLGLLVATMPTPAPAQVQPAEGSCDIHGTVSDSVSQQPLRRVEVLLTQGSSARRSRSMIRARGSEFSTGASTDDGGRFTIPAVPPGDYRIVANKPGYVTAAAMSGIELSAPAACSAGVAVKMLPQAVIAGRLVDDEGAPLQGAIVQAMARRLFRGQMRLAPVSSATTNDRGEYRLLNVKPGRFLLYGNAPNGSRYPLNTSNGTRMKLQPAFYPGTSVSAEATTVVARPGEESGGHDFGLQLRPVFRVSGQVTTPAGGPPSNFALNLVPAMPTWVPASFPFARDAQGRFTFDGVPPGSWLLILSTADSAEPEYGVLPVEVGNGDVEGIEVQTGPGVAVSGVVEVEGLATGAERQKVTVALTPAGTMFLSPSAGEANAQNGAFTIPEVQPVSYQVTVNGQPAPNSYLASMKWGDQEMLGKPVPVGSGGGPLQLVFKTDAGRADGVVDAKDELKSGTSAMVVILPANPEWRTYIDPQVTTTGTQGEFSFSGLRPGDYLVMAIADPPTNPAEDPDSLGAMESRATRITVRSSDVVQFTTPLLHWAGN